MARHRITPIAAVLAIGGAMANTIDRLFHGAVRDFLVAGPVVINLADVAVLVGVTLGAYNFIRYQDLITPASEQLRVRRPPTLLIQPRRASGIGELNWCWTRSGSFAGVL